MSKKVISARIEATQYQQILLANPAGYTDNEKTHFVLARRKYSIRVHKV